jgi:hypothetical protein
MWNRLEKIGGVLNNRAFGPVTVGIAIAALCGVTGLWLLLTASGRTLNGILGLLLVGIAIGYFLIQARSNTPL